MKNRTTIFIRSLQRESLVLQIWRWTYLLTKILNIFTHVRIFATLGGRIIRHTNAESSSKRNSRRNVSFTLENEESHDLLSRNFQHSHWHGCAFHSTRLSAEGTLDNYNTHTHTHNIVQSKQRGSLKIRFYFLSLRRRIAPCNDVVRERDGRGRGYRWKRRQRAKWTEERWQRRKEAEYAR